MVRMIAGTALLALLAACATTAPTPAQQVVGKWSCETNTDGIKVLGKVDYLSDGKAASDVSVAIDQGGMAMTIAATAESTWLFLADGKMSETITKATVTSGNMAGQDVPPAMIQPMMEEMVVNQTSTSTVVFEGSAMTLTDEEGTVTRCTR